MGELRGRSAARKDALIPMSLEDPSISSEAIRRTLFTALQKLDPDEAARAGHDAKLYRLLELVRSYQPLPPDFVAFALGQVDGVTPTEPDRDARAISAWNDWLATNNLTLINPGIAFSPPPLTLRRVSPVPVEPAPFPQDWQALVKETRTRLLEPVPRPPFSHWILPQPVWRATWAEAFDVISSDDHATFSATVLVPSEEAAGSPEARDVWFSRVVAGNRLGTSPARPRTGIVSRILGCAVAATPSYVILERLTHGPRTLAERVRSADCPKPRQLLELGIALCDLLNTLAASQVRIMDLRPELIGFESSEGLRLTQLLDPTAICPMPGFIPELRGSQTSIEPSAFTGEVADRAQVFLVAALILSLLCNTTKLLAEPKFHSGRSTSLATLAGTPELADSEQDRIAVPLIADLRRIHPNNDDSIAIGHLIQILRWALSEEPEERYQSVVELSAALRATSGS